MSQSGQMPHAELHALPTVGAHISDAGVGNAVVQQHCGRASAGQRTHVCILRRQAENERAAVSALQQQAAVFGARLRLGRGGQHIHGPSPCRGRQPEPGHDLVPELADVGVFHIFHQHTHLGLCLPAGTLGRIAHFHRRVQHKLAGLCAHVRRAVQSF